MTAPAAPARPREAAGGIGSSPQRSDGIPKVRGEFEYSSDMGMEGMLWGATLRSPHPRALILSLDTSAAAALPGVRAVLTHADVPGRRTYGLEFADQPVLAWSDVRFKGEPIAIVAADHPETARQAADLIAVEFEVLEPVCDAEQAMTPLAPPLHEGGNVLRRVHIERGDPAATAAVVVQGTYEVGMQDQAFLGPESGLAVPDGAGGVELHIATQWLHVDRDQMAESLGLPPEAVRLSLGGVGGAFGGREDLSMQIHACMLALRTNRPVKMVYTREESFVGHVHRHPCRMEYEHGADADGRLVYVHARIVLDGGAYASSSTAVCSNAACFAAGPYAVPNARLTAFVAYTNNPPCGAMRGFGAVQVAFAHEAQMDKLAAALGVDPVELRIRNAMAPGDTLPTGQLIPEPAPVAELLERVRDMPLPPAADGVPDQRELPGGIANTTHGEGVRRGVGYAVGLKNVGYSEGFDDYSTARVRISADAGGPLVEVHSAAAEVGQGVHGVQEQIARTELGIERVVVLRADTAVGSAGSTSASRQTYVTGGAVKAACEAVREQLVELGADLDDLDALAELLRERPLEATVEWHHRADPPARRERPGRRPPPVRLLRPPRRRRRRHRAGARAGRRAGDRAGGRPAINPQALEGQIEGGSAQGLGLALMEEIVVRDGEVLNASFTDYLIPTTLDMPRVRMDVLEYADPSAPYGLKGVGEPPNITTPPAVVAAVRAATGIALARMPVRPEHIVAR